MLIKTIVKEDEHRVFFQFGGKEPREGEAREQLPYEQEEAEAKIEKLKWERKNGIQLQNFHYDPMAGGLQPPVPVVGQVVKRGPIISFSTGQPVGFEEGKNERAVGRIMLPTGMWVGEWM